MIALAAFAAALQTAPRDVFVKSPAPGIELHMIVEPDAPRITYALRFLPGAELRMESAMARNTVYDATATKGRDTVSNMVQAAGAIGGVNGDFFQWGSDPGGDPTGLHLRGGEILSLPDGDAQWIWSGGGLPEMAQVMAETSLTLAGRAAAVDGLNQRVNAGQLVAATDSAAWIYGVEPITVALVYAGPHRLRSGAPLAGKVVSVSESTAPVSIPAGHFAIAASGARAAEVAALKPGDEASLSVSLAGAARAAEQAMGGGPVLVRQGRVRVNRADDPRHPRTAVGTGADGSVWHVVVDGRQTTSVGASLKELAQIMIDLGCTEAFNLDGGGSSTMNLFGVVLNRPSGGIERTVANGILFYGPRPEVTSDLSLQAPATLKVGESAQALAFDDGVQISATEPGLMWAAQGGAWIDQAGRLRASAPGKARITAWWGGAAQTLEIQILASDAAQQQRAAALR
jgi:hypothetical protein